MNYILFYNIGPKSDFQILLGNFAECYTSATDTGNGDEEKEGDGGLDLPCKFPFTLNKKTYWACTYDYGHLTGFKPWCATKTDRNGNYIAGMILTVNKGTIFILRKDIGVDVREWQFSLSSCTENVLKKGSGGFKKIQNALT